VAEISFHVQSSWWIINLYQDRFHWMLRSSQKLNKSLIKQKIKLWAIQRYLVFFPGNFFIKKEAGKTGTVSLYFCVFLK
jgi:hypothetical protein